MMDVIKERLQAGENPPWNVLRDVKRLEKTGAFLREKLGLQTYFPRSLEVMHYEVKKGDGSPMGGAMGGPRALQRSP